MKIAFVGLYEEMNFGDPVIAECTEWLFLNYLKKEIVQINRVCLDYSERHKKMNLTYIVYKIIREFTKRFRLRKWRKKNYRTLIWRTDLKYFKEKFIGSDFIVVVGGGLIKYKCQLCWLHLSAILDVAEELNIPVFLNSLGVEGYDDSDERCVFLKKALQSKALKRVTLRDDYKLFLEKYLDNRKVPESAEVSDPAIWTKEVFEKYLDKVDVSKEIIGVGIARGEIFESYGIMFSKENARHMYISLIKVLQQKGFKVQLFTNGLVTDNKFAKEIFEELKSNGYCDISLQIPQNPKELISVINSYKAVIATRLHACIISYSLNIPAIGIVWNDKFLLWGKKIGCPENFLKFGEWDSENILEHLEQAMETPYNEILRQELKSSIAYDIASIVKSIEEKKTSR